MELQPKAVSLLIGTNDLALGGEPEQVIDNIKAIISEHKEIDSCAGIGVVVPGMVDRVSGRLLNAPTLGWRDVNLREPLSAATGFLVHIDDFGVMLASLLDDV